MTAKKNHFRHSFGLELKQKCSKFYSRVVRNRAPTQGTLWNVSHLSITLVIVITLASPVTELHPLLCLHLLKSPFSIYFGSYLPTYSLLAFIEIGKAGIHLYRWIHCEFGLEIQAQIDTKSKWGRKRFCIKLDACNQILNEIRLPQGY